MKRARETHGTNDTTTVVPGPNKNTNTNRRASNASSNSALEEIRVKLEQARLKKIAAEERLLLRQKQQDPPTSKCTAASTACVTKQQSRAKLEAQEALDRARSRLQGARENRDRALQQQLQQNQTDPSGTNGTQIHQNKVMPWNRNNIQRQQYISPQQQRQDSHNNNIPPISALLPSFSLKITNISETGPPEMVYHYEDTVESPFSSMGRLGSRAALIEALGGKEAVYALHRRGSDNNRQTRSHGEDTAKCHNAKNSSVAANANANANQKKQASISLVQRKIQLQNELLALKEKLEMKSSQDQKQKQEHRKSSTTTGTNAAAAHVENKSNSAAAHEENKNNRKTAKTKEGLERRKAEAQTVMDISYWKHFVSKQEHLLEQVTAKINDVDRNKGGGGANTYKECLQRRHATNKAIAKVQQDLDTIENRQRVVEEGIFGSTEKLLEARQALHEAKH